MIVVTGGAGFIGSNIVKALNERGEQDILVVDHLENGVKFKNIADCEIMDYMERDNFIEKIKSNEAFPQPIKAIFHEGACSSTTEWDGRFMMRNNYEYSKILLHYCLDNDIQYLYASSASVYGAGTNFAVARENECPINMYAYSKFLFDQYVRRILPNARSQVAGFRYFNVYGPREQHKDSMSSTAFHFNRQVKTDGIAKLFTGCDGYDDGEQRRDFIYVGDTVAVNLWFYDNPDKSGIYNLGTGQSRSFNDMANAVIVWHELRNKEYTSFSGGNKEYIPFPDHLKGRYQSFTEADITALRSAGYEAPFLSVEKGVSAYLDWLNG